MTEIVFQQSFYTRIPFKIQLSISHTYALMIHQLVLQQGVVPNPPYMIILLLYPTTLLLNVSITLPFHCMLNQVLFPCSKFYSSCHHVATRTPSVFPSWSFDPSLPFIIWLSGDLRILVHCIGVITLIAIPLDFQGHLVCTIPALRTKRSP